jgi:putative ABC transport system permease protein
MAGAVEGVAQAEMWFTQPASILKARQRIREAGVGAELDGLPTGSDFFKPLIVAGRWLQPGDGRVIVMNQETAKENNINLGDVITLDLGALGDSEWQVIGFYRIIFGGSFSTDAIYAPLEAVFQATTKHNEGSVLRVRTHRHTAAYQDVVRNQLVNLYTGRNIDVFFNQTASEERQNADSQFSIITSMLLALAIIVAVVGGVGLMGSLSISVIERIREIGVMRAIGARSFTLMGMFVMEGVLQGIFSWLMAIPISFLLAEALSKALGQVMFEANLDYQYNYTAVLVWLAIILGISILAALLPARNATRISVRESLQYY